MTGKNKTRGCQEHSTQMRCVCVCVRVIVSMLYLRYYILFVLLLLLHVLDTLKL